MKNTLVPCAVSYSTLANVDNLNIYFLNLHEKGNINSILLQESHLKVSLVLYITQGGTGRETDKERK